MFWCALRFLPFEKMDQRNCIKFCVKNDIKCARAFETLIVAFDDVHSSRPSMLRTDENIERVMEMILYNRRITVRERLLMMLA